MGAVQRLVQRARQVSASDVADVPSPCVSVCRMDPRTQWCEGCFRTLDEIAAWSRMEDEGRREVWAMIAQRALLHREAEREAARAEMASEQKERT